MKKERRYQTKQKMYISYIVIPVLILSVFSVAFTFGYYRVSKERILTFENAISQNVDDQLKNTMDNLLKSASQYSMTPWVKRLKYMQKIPEMMKRNITASDISDYASTICLTEINDNIIESVYIYYSLGEFGISSSGRIGWEEYTDVYEIQSGNQELMSGELLRRNNQRVICHDVTLTKNAKQIRGFFLIQTIPLENSYSGEVNMLFFVPYRNIYNYIEKFTDDGTRQLCLTDGTKVLYTKEEAAESGKFAPGDLIMDLKSEEKGFVYHSETASYISEYTKVGMDIGVLQVLDHGFLYRDFFAFLKWIVMGYLLLFCLILVVASKMAKRSYQPLEHIINLLEEEQEDGVDEYEMIEKALRDLESQKKELEVAVYEQNPLIEQYILHGLVNAKKLGAVEEKYVNMMRQYSLFRSLVLGDGPEARQYIAEIDACLAVYPQIHAAFLKEDGYYFWILSYGEESLMAEIAELLGQTFGELGYRDAVMGLGNVHDEIREVPEACRQAVAALGYHFFYPEQKMLLFGENGIELREQNEAEFEVTQQEQEELEEKIRAVCKAASGEKTSVAGGNALGEKANAADSRGSRISGVEELYEVYQRVVMRNFSGRMLSKERWFDAVRRLNEYVAGLFWECGSLVEPMEVLDPENFGSLESYLQTLRLKLEHLANRCQSRENPMYAARNEKIRQYVEAHLTDANLSLNETARVMHYTSTYFGKYFKEQFGCAFQQYVAVRRIECAKQYLQDNPEGKKMSIQEIALKCGFTNDVTFRRTFKRYVGVTPSQFGKEEW